MDWATLEDQAANSSCKTSLSSFVWPTLWVYLWWTFPSEFSSSPSMQRCKNKIIRYIRIIIYNQQLKFPSHVVMTTLRPDILLVSEVTRNIVMLELTVLWEDHLEEAHERKKMKYEELVIDCRKQGWKARRMPIGNRSTKPWVHWESPEWGGQKPSGTSQRQRRKTQDGSGSVEEVYGEELMPTEHKSGSDHPRLGRLGEGV